MVKASRKWLAFFDMLTHLRNKVKALEAFSFERELEKIVSDNKEKLADLQRDQLFAGKDANNKPLTLEGEGYAPFTLIMKFRKNQPTDRVTWRDSGEMHRSLQAFVIGAKFSIRSNNFKFFKMLERSGEEAQGLNIDSRTIFVNQVTRPKILEVYREKVSKV